MAPRPVVALIIAFWLVTVGWFVRREVLPHWRSGEAPPYTIELADEAIRLDLPTRWGLYRNGNRLGTVRTLLKYRDRSDDFEFSSEAQNLKLWDRGISITLADYRSEISVNRAGELRGMLTNVKLDIAGTVVNVKLSAAVNEAQIVPKCLIESPLGAVESDLAPIPHVKASVLTPLHPVHRIKGLQPGQRWTMPMVDPLAEAQKAAVQSLASKALGRNVDLPNGSTTCQIVTAEVLPPQPLELDGQFHSCLVIEQTCEGFRALTWVRISDNYVLKQEAWTDGEHLLLQRE